MINRHWKFVGWVEAINTPDNVWAQRIVKSTLFDDTEVRISWRMTKVPLPDGAQQGTYISVHRTKAGHWYAVNLSERMPRTTLSQIKRSAAEARRMMHLIKSDQEPTHD